MAGGVPGERTLQETPTWAVAVVCAVFIIVSVFIEQGIHSLEKWFKKRHKKTMTEALEKIKAELMLLGFISLLLTFGTNYIAKICIPVKLGDTMLPCKKVELESDDDLEHRRRLGERNIVRKHTHTHMVDSSSSKRFCYSGEASKQDMLFWTHSHTHTKMILDKNK